MSIVDVEVKNAQGNLLTLSLEDISNGFIVKEIDGLDPVKSNIVSSEFANIEGQQYQANSRETRNVIIKLGYAPNFGIGETIRVLRSRLYQFFMTGMEVTLTFHMADGLSVQTTGRVEDCAAPLFSQEPQMDISIICFNPDFIDTELQHISGPMTIIDTEPYVFTYEGTVPVGVTAIGFTCTETLGDFAIYHTTPSGELRTMQITAPLLSGDTVVICSIKGQKTITLTRASVTSSLLWAVSPQSDWVQLEVGENQIYLNAGDATQPSLVWLDYYNHFGGL
jgi:hypothetical protein